MKNKISSNRSFGITFSIFFLLLSLYFFFKNEKIYYSLIIISLIFLTLGVLKSKILTNPNKIWVMFGEKLGFIIAPIIMALVYFTVVTPIALILKICGKDVLNIKNKKAQTYWVNKKNINSMKKQY